MTLVASCSHPDPSGDCSNGTCLCAANTSCDFSCRSPPCHVDCGYGASCSGTCANGDCICEVGASCTFACGAPPCQVTCEGSNPTCDGTCADGTCTCEPGSVCHFACASGPCHADCPAGASCAVACPHAGLAGTQDCDIASCGAGKPVVCPDGLTVTCGTACPSD